MCAPMRLCDLVILRYAVSEWSVRRMFLDM